ncbi:MAG TPA: methionine--tRNA ligase [Vicinamibacterales bacterium]|nr:methionine--tRNA ligase [Vicinamibacterales bacterium]
MTAFFITTPIYYINAQPHVGHAYTTMLADAVARAHRLMGHDVYFLTGTDEHGQKVERAAQKSGLPTPAFADQVAASFRQMCRDLSISNDDFIRTTEPRHYAAAQEIWNRVQKAGDIYKGEYEGWYCTVDEIFVPEAQLVDGKCPTCGSKVERLKEESYYFRLSKYQQPLLDWYRDHPDFVQPEFRLNEVRAFVEAGLQDLSISRTSFKWGIPVPGDPKHVMYVWFDALTNYLTTLGFGSGQPDESARIQKYWPTVTHFIGKEIVRQHALYWPAFLMSAGIPPPRRVIAHGFWLMGGAKMSKSLGNVARYQPYAQVFGVDGLRYFALREMPLGQDANFSDEGVLTRFNADLANDLGNLVSRATTMIHRYREGRVPDSPKQARDQFDLALQREADETIGAVKNYFATFQVSLALQEIWSLIRDVNKYIVEREPWKLAKDEAQRGVLDRTLYHSADSLRVVAALVDPVMPNAAARIRAMLGVSSSEPWTALSSGTLAAGSQLGAVEPLFPRIEKTVEELRGMTAEHDSATPASPAPAAAPPAAQPAPAPQATPAAAPAPASAAAVAATDGRIAIDDFMKVELRVAKILEAEAVPKSKKLIKMKVDVGTEQRTIVAGIAEAYQPDQLVGRTIVIVANLKPAKLMGIESNGMVLAASPEGGLPSLLAVDPALPAGSRVR